MISSLVGWRAGPPPMVGLTGMVKLGFAFLPPVTSNSQALSLRALFRSGTAAFALGPRASRALAASVRLATSLWCNCCAQTLTVFALSCPSTLSPENWETPTITAQTTATRRITFPQLSRSNGWQTLHRNVAHVWHDA